MAETSVQRSALIVGCHSCAAMHFLIVEIQIPGLGCRLSFRQLSSLQASGCDLGVYFTVFSFHQGALKVLRTTARVVQIQVDIPILDSNDTVLYTDTFKIGHWHWFLSIQGEVNNSFRFGNPHISICPCDESISKCGAPVASLTVRVLARWTSCEFPTSSVVDLLIKKVRDHLWELNLAPLKAKDVRRFIVELEFHDLKVTSLLDQVPQSIWARTTLIQSHAQNGFNRMLEDALHTDVSIVTANDGNIAAHRAVLAARSPVLNKMFSHDLTEKQLIVHLSDMTLEECRAFLGCIYGSVTYEEFAEHRLVLLRASHKYDIPELKDACGDSLGEDITTETVLDRLQHAWDYGVDDLKQKCLTYLLEFGKVHDIEKEFFKFVSEVDAAFVLEIVEKQCEVLRSCQM